MNLEEKIEELVLAISSNPKYNRAVFEVSSIYFAISKNSIFTISNDAGESARGSWFPAIISHPSKEKEDYLNAKMDELGFDCNFFEDALEEYDPDDVECYFEDQDDEESAEICRKLEAEIEAGNTPFYDLGDLVKAVKYLDLDDDLYYEWEGELITLYDNIVDIGEEPGYYDSLTDEEWVDILENIEKYVVVAN